MDTVNSWLQSLDKIQGWSAVALVVTCGIVVGYILRFVKRFPNDGIPVAVILFCAVAMLVLADPRANNMPARIWVGRNLLVGLVLGLISWLAHKIILTKLEDYLATKSNFVSNALNKPAPPCEPETKGNP